MNPNCRLNQNASKPFVLDKVYYLYIGKCVEAKTE